MRVEFIEEDFTKLCHAKPGDAVVFVSALMTVEEGPYMVCVVPDVKKRSMRPGMSHGLYDDERILFLVHLETGEMREAPNLSSRVIIYTARTVLSRERRKT